MINVIRIKFRSTLFAQAKRYSHYQQGVGVWGRGKRHICKVLELKTGENMEPLMTAWSSAGPSPQISPGRSSKSAWMLTPNQSHTDIQRQIKSHV